jgi:cytidine deaminase
MNTNIDNEKLVNEAYNAMKNSYSPYSGYRVGASVLTRTGKIFSGTNIENSSFGAGICAERNAIFKAVSDGEKNIRAVAVISQSDEITFPCGICRQVMSEFMDPDAIIICANRKCEYKVFGLQDLLPHMFKLKQKEELKIEL